MDYTVPYAHVPSYAYTQSGRTEFDNRLDRLDWSKVAVAGLDGEGSTTVAREKLPDAHFVILPQIAQVSGMLTSVVSKKADIAFVIPTVFKDFNAANKGGLRKIASDHPFHVFNVAFGIKADEPAFKNMLDFMLRNAMADGTLRGLFLKYDPEGLLMSSPRGSLVQP